MGLAGGAHAAGLDSLAVTASQLMEIGAADITKPAPATRSLGERSLIVVVGMQSEAKAARGSNTEVITGAMREDELRAKLAALDTSKVGALISFGVAGGLDPSVKVGDMVVPDTIIYNNRTWRASPELSREIRLKLERAGIFAHRGPIVGVEGLTQGRADWREQFRRTTGADAVDMETHIAAEFAESRDIPFTAIRAISDTVGQTLPPAAMLPLNENGGVRMNLVIGSILWNPGQIGDLIRTGRDFQTAMETLRRGRAELGYLFDKN